MQKVLLSIFLMANIVLIQRVLAQDKQRGKELFKTCIQCHGEKGEGNKEKNAPRIGGQHDWYILSSLIQFKKKERINPEMYPYIKSLSEKDFKDLASYIGGLK
ncbi:MAG: cytochrome c [Halobacteriovoraceae bacterium]|nr:cytochrome c [Halobacteriovoraceae bacterium]